VITRRGWADWLPAQFCQRGGAVTMPGPYPSTARPGTELPPTTS
jgi:hypothetical protein